MLFSNQPLNPQELSALRRRIGTTEDSLASSPMPTDIGSGLQRLGSAVGLAAMRARYNSQFPDAPQMPGGGYAPQAKPPIQNFLETVSGNRMPWQFPAAPAGVKPPLDSTGWNLPMTSPRQGDRQQPPISNMPSTAPSPMMGSVFGSGNAPAPISPTNSITGNVLASTGATLPPSSPGGFFGLFKQQAPSGLW